MGRLVLLILPVSALLWVAGCVDGDSPEERAAPAQVGHADLTCATCHRGGVADHGEPGVPREACTESGCHEDAGPARVAVGTVTFEHRGHGGEPRVSMACAGCHEHDRGGEAVTAGTDACSLCHAEELDGDEAGDCRTCHGAPDHLGFTSQGVAVPHEGLPWVRGECVRCHYDVSDPGQTVSAVTCARCHDRLEEVTAAGIGQDLHPGHTGVGCTSCHAAESHHIVGMSSAVDLACADCHSEIHEVRVTGAWPAPGTCNACHRTVHDAQQRLVLGAIPYQVEAVPSEKFLNGLTCRSCHVTGPGNGSGGGAVAGSAISCSGCHRPEYRTVLRWWDEGTTQRQRLVGDYLRTAEGAVGGAAPDTTRALLAEAQDLLALVEAAGGEHNLPLAHRLFTEILDRAAAAYRSAGRAVPAPPDLGTRPRMGLCTYCHYRTDDRWRFGDMDERFHREVLGVGQLESGQGG